MLAVRGLPGWLLWDQRSGCPYVRQRLFKLVFSGAGCISVMTRLKKDKKTYRAAVRQWSDENVRETAPQTPRQWGRMGRRCCRHQRTFPGHLRRRPWRHWLAPCSLWRNTVQQTSTLQSNEDVMTTRDKHALKKPAAHREPMHFLSGTVGLGRPMLEQSIPEGLYAVERTRAGGGPGKQQPKGKTHVEAAHKGLYPVGMTSSWTRGRVQGWRRSRGKVLWADHSSYSLALCATWQGRREKNQKWRREAEPGISSSATQLYALHEKSNKSMQIHTHNTCVTCTRGILPSLCAI